MKLATLRTPDGGTTAARVEGDLMVPLPFADVGSLLASGHDWRDSAAAAGKEQAYLARQVAPVVLNPGKIICVGLNYRSHIEEMGRQLPEYPTLFAKFSGALIGAHDPIYLPAVSDMVDWEAELAVVIGRSGRHIAPEEAADHVAGYTIINDVTVRDWQHRTREFLSGKTFERTTPLGPWLVTADEVDAARTPLQLRCLVDSDERQATSTSDLLFDVADLVSYISQIITLEPGDVIATGTPGGVGAGMNPPVFLANGQVLTTQIEGLGEQHNPCLKESAP